MTFICCARVWIHSADYFHTLYPIIFTVLVIYPASYPRDHSLYSCRGIY